MTDQFLPLSLVKRTQNTALNGKSHGLGKAERSWRENARQK